jgi:hypothetical protein
LDNTVPQTQTANTIQAVATLEKKIQADNQAIDEETQSDRWYLPNITEKWKYTMFYRTRPCCQKQLNLFALVKHVG